MYYFIIIFVDVERGIDEKLAAPILENSTRLMSPKLCVFTVVQNCFAALEATQHTNYDCIIVEKGIPCLDIRGMLKVMRALGNNVPFVIMVPFLLRKQENDTITEEMIDENSLRNEMRQLDYSDVLMQPYSSTTLCQAITGAIQYNECQVALAIRQKQLAEMEAEALKKQKAWIAGQNTSTATKPDKPPTKRGRKKSYVHPLKKKQLDKEYKGPPIKASASTVERKTRKNWDPDRTLGHVLDEIDDPPEGMADPAADYVRILTELAAQKERNSSLPEAQPQQQLTSSEETAQWLTEMANK